VRLLSLGGHLDREVHLKVACYIHPVTRGCGPSSDYFWFERLAKLLQTLRGAAATECMIISKPWFHSVARTRWHTSLLEGLLIGTIDETSMFRRCRAIGVLPAALDRLAYGIGGKDHPALQIVADEVGRCSQRFKPDVVIAFGIQADFLAHLWPKALVLHVETGAYSRNPYPFSMYFDHLGMYRHSAVGRAGKELRASIATADGRSLVSAFRANFAAALAAVDPFRRQNLRAEFRRLCLLPLQVSNDYSFDEQTEYRTQFEFLHDVLSATPRDVGVIATEYLEFGDAIKAYGPGENLAYLRHTFPNLVFREEFHSYCAPSQFLVPRVDGVWTASSNVGYQGLLYGRVLGTPATTHLAGLADATTYADFLNRLDRPSPANSDAFLAWQLENYLVPDRLLNDAQWLFKYFERRLDAAHSADDPIDAFVPIADLDRLMEAWIAHAPKPLAVPFHSEINALLQSTSWRITAPLRAIAPALRALYTFVTRLFSRAMPTRKATSRSDLERDAKFASGIMRGCACPACVGPWPSRL
jgi:hypothetical protein